MLADSDIGVSKGALRGDGKVLSKLIGRPKAKLQDTVATVLCA